MQTEAEKGPSHKGTLTTFQKLPGVRPVLSAKQERPPGIIQTTLACKSSDYHFTDGDTEVGSKRVGELRAVTSQPTARQSLGQMENTTERSQCPYRRAASGVGTQSRQIPQPSEGDALSHFINEELQAAGGEANGTS